MSDLKFDQILDEYVRFCNDSGKIDLNLYEEYNVKRGLRDSNGRGVLTGLTEVSDVMGFSVVDGHRVPIPGELYFQGYEVQQLVQGFIGTVGLGAAAQFVVLGGQVLGLAGVQAQGMNEPLQLGAVGHPLAVHYFI